MHRQIKAALADGLEVLIIDIKYYRKAEWLRYLKPRKALFLAKLKSTIIWFPTHGLMSIVVGDWLIQTLRLRAA